jgi:ankyrin repeat protein
LISAPELSKHLTTSHSPLHDAINNGECPTSSHILIADFNLRDENGQSPLFTASMHGHCDVVKCLLSSGADINLCDEVVPQTMVISLVGRIN